MQFVKQGPDIPDRLLEAHEEGQVVFFCGAGISVPAGLPMFGGLVHRLYAAIGGVPTQEQSWALENKHFDTALTLLEQYVGKREAVRGHLLKALTPSHPNATDTHEALLDLARLKNGRLRLITTNFDRLFESILLPRTPKIETFRAPLLPIPKPHIWNGLVYLHGLLTEDPTTDNLNNLVLSSGDFGRAYLTEGWAARFVGELFRNFSVCFLGYSLNDPVLRYMMDALAADQMLGGNAPQMYAFGDFKEGYLEVQREEWRSKHVTPILYAHTEDHTNLHLTLREWARTYRDGFLGKERIVNDYAMARPIASTPEDDFVGRMLWALSDKEGLPAKRFADLDPPPSIEWLDPLGETRFGHDDLPRFKVSPGPVPGENLSFSMLYRPTHYSQAPRMCLAHRGEICSEWDAVMKHLARWLAKHLDSPELILWVASQGGRLHPDFRWHISSVLKSRPPSPPMATLWRLALADRIHPGADLFHLFRWIGEVKKEGINLGRRLEFREIFKPYLRLRPRMPWPETPSGPTEAKQPKDLMSVELELASDHVHTALKNAAESPIWIEALPQLYPEALSMLRDALDLMAEAQMIDHRCDHSYSARPSISDHSQNGDYQDWTALITLVRDGWLALAAQDPKAALNEAQTWMKVPFPLFKRLAYFAAAQPDLIPHAISLEWLLDDNGWWLWSVETQRESLRLIQVLAPHLDDSQREIWEQAILQGPPREMYQPNLADERWVSIVDRQVWLPLSKAHRAGLTLSSRAEEALTAISARNPDWALGEDDRDEFPVWSSGVSRVGGTKAMTSRSKIDLLDWLRKTKPDPFESDDWRDRCRVNLPGAMEALSALADEENWLVERWHTALQVCAEEAHHQSSWGLLPPILERMPGDAFGTLRRPIAWWLQSVAKSIPGMGSQFEALVLRMLQSECAKQVPLEEDPFEQAINHPVGLTTEGLLQQWYHTQPSNDQGLQPPFQQIFTKLCDTSVQSFQMARVILIPHAISLFLADPEWARTHLIPLFDWNREPQEAVITWRSFLWAPRLFRPFMAVIKQHFLACVNHFPSLGHPQIEQFGSIVAVSGLDPDDPFTIEELAQALQSLPPEGLEAAARTLAQAQESAVGHLADHWHNRVATFWQRAWPKGQEANTPKVANHIAALCLAAGDAFPDSLREIGPFLRRTTRPEPLLDALKESGHCNRYPSEALDWLDKVVADSMEWPSEGLSTCLSQIRSARPDLAADPRFRRLDDIRQRYGN